MSLTRPFDSLAGRTAVVTGGARGLGHAIAAALRDVGMTVLIVDRDAAALAAGLEELAGGGGTVEGVATTLSTDECVEPIEAALAALPPLSVWVNNAGRVSHEDAEAVDLHTFEEVMRDNTVSALRGSQLAFRRMTGGRGSGGAVVNITSLVTEKALPQRLSYATSKAALENVTRYCAQEWGPHGIRVNAVSPGYIDTRLTQWSEDDPRAVAKRAVVGTLPLRRTGGVDDIAATVLYLASPLAAYVTGQTVFVDGGWHLA
ncbi:SDR family NAD(P)-dependent oxidoreductase [Actinoallomurus iriomotensis]|uniref:Short-chain dehydrogenase n=1 Tax=Actinoallomurus iriomotensis TaxID=478107 RepID=A0A9W6SAM5_9ACTN|nr:SDR family oxidoreductase [Actinoallomurus iriomotensis]GLY88855.1 short-chain dehydrogenase [Actinoallomurus iriomotensis]